MHAVLKFETETGETIVRRVKDLAKNFRDRVPTTEATRNVPAESIAELVAAGVARMMVPKEHGGLDLRMRDLSEVTSAAAYGCPSTGWLTCLIAGVPHILALFPEEARRAIWANGPDIIGAGALGVKATAVNGGYRISGHSPFASGVNNAQWVYLAGPVVPASGAPSGPPDIRFFVVPKADYTILDTWHTVAMRGTGSNTVVTENVFVPEAFTVSVSEMRDGTAPGATAYANPSFRLPWAAYSAIGFVSTMLGAAEGAHDEVVRILKAKRDPAGNKATDSEVVQVSVGLANSHISTARMLILAVADRADSDPDFGPMERAGVMRDMSYAARLLRQAIDLLVEITGTSGFAMSSPVQQFWRDGAFAAAHQGLNSRLLAGYYGRLILEVEDPQRPMFY